MPNRSSAPATSAPKQPCEPEAQADTIVFAGGGTGGHLYPALGVAERIADVNPWVRFLFLCSDRPVDRAILSRAGVRFQPVPARPFALHPLRLVRFVSSWPRAVAAAEHALGGVCCPGAVVVAMGGFVAAPAVRAAARLGLPVVVINLDAVPGKANRWISRQARLTLASAGSDRLPNAMPIRPIVRRGAIAGADASTCRGMLGLDRDTRTLFVTGGSQGARSINDLMRLLVAHHVRLFDGWQVFHQAGTEDVKAVQEAYDRAGVAARVVAFCQEMGLAWGAANLAITRCGAGAVAEVWANAVPAVFLPYPYHRDQHQRYNAQPIVRSGGGVICEDRGEADRTIPEVSALLEGLMGRMERLAAMREAIRSLGPADGAEQAASVILRIT